ncbi:hypothetical protein BDN70DRAFT_884282 [Pholiota conissans]|uniref:Uncharacterized protein n=1 Tax=Pholiota conissans TaxID=109636 RepID=A0A9P5YTR1_9AGAR|nr:hypothetical protein BDN70DRAFT_884282 [Pholiota conissans]
MRVILQTMVMILDTVTMLERFNSRSNCQGNNITYDVQQEGPRSCFEAMGSSFNSEYDATPNLASL